jgi:hypothetical protein
MKCVFAVSILLTSSFVNIQRLNMYESTGMDIVLQNVVKVCFFFHIPSNMLQFQECTP